MSKRRQTIAGCPVEKKSKLDESLAENCDNVAVPELTDKQLRQCLTKFGEVPGPVMPSTRHLYEKLLQKYRDGDKAPISPPSTQSTPSRPSKVAVKPAASTSNKKPKSPVDCSPERLSPTTPPVVIDSLPDPPSGTKIHPPKKTPKTKRTPLKQSALPKNLETLTNKQIRDQLVELGETPGPINNANRKLYLELLCKYNNGDMAHTVAARRLLAKEEPILSSTRIEPGSSQQPRNRNSLNQSRPILSANGSTANRSGFVFPETITPIRESGEEGLLKDYPEDEEDEEEMETNTEPSMCVSYVKSPYKKTRRSVCKAEFESTDFVVFSGTDNAPNRPSQYIEMGNNGIQAFVTQDSNTVALINAIKAAKGCVKIYAGVTICSVKKGRIAVSNAVQCGADAVVVCFSKYECSDATAIAVSIKQVLEGHLTSSYFYYHNPNTKACPVRISKQLLGYNNGYQGIFVSPETEEKLLQLEILGIKIYETDSTKILRSLAHGIDSFASFEGIIAMPVIRKLKEEYYEGNTSECCRLQLILCRLVRSLTKYGDLLPSMQTALKYLGQSLGELPAPLQPLKNEVLLMKELADLNIDKWQNINL